MSEGDTLIFEGKFIMIKLNRYFMKAISAAVVILLSIVIVFISKGIIEYKYDYICKNNTKLFIYDRHQYDLLLKEADIFRKNNPNKINTYDGYTVKDDFSNLKKFVSYYDRSFYLNTKIIVIIRNYVLDFPEPFSGTDAYQKNCAFDNPGLYPDLL